MSNTNTPLNPSVIYSALALLVAGVVFYYAFGNSYIYSILFVLALDTAITHIPLNKGRLAFAIMLSSFVVDWTMGFALGNLWFVSGLLFAISDYYNNLKTKSIFGKD